MIVSACILFAGGKTLSGQTGKDSGSFSELPAEKQLAIRELVRPPSPHGRYGCYSTPNYYFLVEGYEYRGDRDKDPDKRCYKSQRGKPGLDWGSWRLDRNRPDWQEAMLQNWAKLGLNNTHLNIFPQHDSLEITPQYRQAIKDYVRLSEKYGLKIGVRMDALDGHRFWSMHPNNPANIGEEYVEWAKEIAGLLKGRTAYYILGDELTLYKADDIHVEAEPSPEDLMAGRVSEDYKKWTPEMYLEYFKKISSAIKSVDPDAIVSMFAASSGGWFNILYLLEKGYADYGDAVAINFYHYHTVPSFFDDARRLAPDLLFLSNGVGYVSAGTVSQRYPEGDPYSKLPTEEAHGKMIAKNMFAWWDLGAATAPYYITLRNWIIDGKTYPRWFGFFGFEDFVINEYDHLTVKRYPGWYAFQTIAHTFYNRQEAVTPSFDVKSSEPLTMLRAYVRELKGGKELLLMLWNDAREAVETELFLATDEFRYPVRVNIFNYNDWQDQPFQRSDGGTILNLKVNSDPLIIRMVKID